MLAAIRLAQDVPAVWDVGRPERKRQLVWALCEKVKVREGRIVPITPKSDVAALFALPVRNSGPDRGRHRQTVIAGVQVEGLDDLLDAASVA